MTKRSKSNKLREKNKQKYKEYHSGIHRSGASTNPERKLDDKQVKGHTFYRSKDTINRLNMYNEKPDYEKMRKQPNKPARIQPDRKWFGNVRTIDQKSLEKFRIEMAQRSHDPRQVLIKANKLPMSLLVDPTKENKVKILQIEKYEDTFGPKSKRKRVKLNSSNLDEMLQQVTEKHEDYTTDKDKDLHKMDLISEKNEHRDKRMEAGQSKRIWEELYKVLDSSDVIVQVIDARDPMGTRCNHVEEHVKKNCPHKHIILLLNKCDLVPTWVTARWIRYLSKEFPTLAYRASLTKTFGKASLINLLKQYDKFHKDKKNISVGFIGYPNVGKSSIINTLKSKKVCKAAPIPGETKVWQYITLTKRIYLIDCPGIVYQNEGKNDVEVVLKGCIRAEKIDDPTFYIKDILQVVKPDILKKLYGIDDWVDYEDFLKKIAEKKGKLLRVFFNDGGEPDQIATSKIVLMDWQRGEIPYFYLPPDYIPQEEMDKLKNEQEEEIQLDELNKQAEQILISREQEKKKN